MKRKMKAGVSILASAALAASMCALPTGALAAGGLGGKVGSETNWTVPDSKMANTVTVDGKLHKVTTTWANAWALSGPDYLGVANSGPLNQQGGGAGSSQLSDAQNNTLLGIWASEANEVPNAYNWNYFYNLALSEKGEPLVDTAAVDVQNGSVPGFESESGVWAPFKYRPEIIWTSNSLDANGVATYTQYIRDGKYYDGKTMQTHEEEGANGRKTTIVDSPGEPQPADNYYIAEDENYNPKVISANSGTAYTFTNSFYELADLAEEVAEETKANNADGAVTAENVTWKNMNALPRTTRYEASAESPMSAEECALAVEKVTRGAVYYTLSQIDEGAVTKKKVAFLTKDPEDGTATVVKYDFIDQIGGGATGGKTNTAALVVDQLTTSKKVDRTEANARGVGYTTYTATADQLSRCDYVVDANGSMTVSELQSWVVDNASSTANKKRATESVQYLTNSPAIMNGHNYTSEKLIWGAFNIDFFYPELWPNMELTTFWYDNVYHLKSEAVKTAMQWGLANASLPEETSLSALGNGYSATDVDAKVAAGVAWFADAAESDPYDSNLFAPMLPSDTLKAWASTNSEKLANAKKNADAVANIIAALPSNPTAADEAAVKAAQEAYNALSDDEKAIVAGALGASGMDVLNAANEKIEASKAKPATATKKAQTITVKTTSKTYKVKKLKKKAQSFKIGAAAKTKLTYKVTKKDAKKKVTFKNGKVTVKKGTKKGTYTMKVKATAAANGTYKAATKTITIKVTVKK